MPPSHKTYQMQDLGLIDYQLCEEADSAPLGLTIPIRKPIPSGKGYIACIGAAQTFGRFVERPFGHQLGQRLGLEVGLFAKGGTGPEYWLNKQPKMVARLADASVTIVQVMSARSASSSFVKNPEWVNATKEIVSQMVEKKQHEELKRYIAETQANYVANMVRLLDAIPGKKVLFWFSQRTRDWSPEFKTLDKVWGEFPHMVSREMIDSLIPHASAYVECINGDGLPAPLGIDAKGRVRVNRYYPSQEMHDAATAALEPVIRGLLANRKTKPEGDDK